MQQTLETLRRELTESVAGLSDAQTQATRTTGKWTIQQIVEHLTLSYAATCDAVAVRLAKGTPTKGSPSLMQRTGQFAIVTCGLFPAGRTAPPAVVPQDAPARRLNGTELTDSIRDSLVRMDQALTAAEDLFGPTRRAISHLVLGPMSVPQWRKFHLAHARHHRKQILATRACL